MVVSLGFCYGVGSDLVSLGGWVGGVLKICVEVGFFSFSRWMGWRRCNCVVCCGRCLIRTGY